MYFYCGFPCCRIDWDRVFLLYFFIVSVGCSVNRGRCCASAAAGRMPQAALSLPRLRLSTGVA